VTANIHWAFKLFIGYFILRRFLSFGNRIKLRGKTYRSVAGNELTSVPEELGRLHNLRWLDLSNNQLTTVPMKLERMRDLRRLDLSDNQLKAVPTDLGRLKNLEQLALHGNQLTAVPPDLGQLSKLRALTLSYNLLTVVPMELAQLRNLLWLNLSNNQLTTIPVALAQLGRLQFLGLDNNQLRYPPEIVEGGDQEIRAYLRALDGAKREWISKTVVVGESGVGKTSLLRALRGEPFVADEETTHGIEIKQLPLAHTTEEGVTILLNTWDFGGQEIYHATHQFFLTNRSLYVLAWNARLGYEQGKLNYWLDTIAVRAPQSPVIVIATHTDEREADLPLAELQRSYPQIVDLVKISNKTGDGIDRLRQPVTETSAALPLMGEEWPAAWARVRHAVRELAATRNHITPNELAALLDEHEVTGTQARVLIKWLHELGEILFFQDEAELNDTVILNSQWVTEAISRVLESEEVIADVGIFSREHMNRLWRDLPPAMREHFLRLMEQFDLSYRILEDRDKSLVIERVPFDPPAYEQRWEAHKEAAPCREIKMRFALDATMPAGIPTWFIARSHRFSLRTHWRHGALFGDDRQMPNHLGLVQAYPHDRYVLLNVRGPAPQNFFALLRDGLELTFNRFPGLGITRKVPCRGHDEKPCEYEFDLAHLEKRLERGKATIECNLSGEDVDVARLLYGIDRDTTQQRLEEMLAKYVQASTLELQELRTYVQREFTKVFNAEQNKEESRCPYFFVLRSVMHGRDIISIFDENLSAGVLDRMREKGWKRRLELQLYCQVPGEIHPLGYERGKDNPATGLYQIEVNTEFLATIAPGVKAVARMLRFVQPALASWMSWTDEDQYLKQFHEDLERMQKLGEKIPESLDEARSAQLSGTMREGYTPQQAGGAMLRALKLLLEEKDRQQTWGGLKRILTKEGHHLWLCPHHLAEYKQ
jgi:small GTP-binding protein